MQSWQANIKRFFYLVICLLCVHVMPAYGKSETVKLSDLPDEARATLKLIKQGGPYQFRRDGIVFENRERRLREQPRGYYREYTVITPGEASRGARRIVSGGNPAVEFFYSADHYKSFQKIQE